MLPTPAAQENLAPLLRRKLAEEARKCIFGPNYNNIEKLIEKRKWVYTPAKSVSITSRMREYPFKCGKKQTCFPMQIE